MYFAAVARSCTSVARISNHGKNYEFDVREKERERQREREKERYERYER